jgi:recombination endonuclease VII
VAAAVKPQARCPGLDVAPCGKIVTVTAAGTFANHRRPAGGNCSVGILDRVRIADRVHPCVDCAALPVGPGVLVDVGGTMPNGPDGPRYRPARPRVATGRPPRCVTHRRPHLKAAKARRRASERTSRTGFPEGDRAALWAAQGERCGICAVPLNAERKAPELDHDHGRARQHDHPDDQVCRACARGLLCRTCNLHVVGRLDRAALLRALAWTAGTNTATSMGWWDNTPKETRS